MNRSLLRQPLNGFAHPRAGLLPALLNRLANWRGLRRLRRWTLGRLPFVTLASDVSDVVYLTWAVPTESVQGIVPPGVDVLERQGLTLFTVLSYRHGHFGPAGAGVLRRLFPSPLQSNWRLYVDLLPDGLPARRVVLFVKNVFDSLAYAVGSRLGSDALPSHLAARFDHRKTVDGYETVIEPGLGSAPALSSTTVRTGSRELPSSMTPFFTHWEEAVAFLCEQDAAVVAVEDEARIAQAGISLPIDLSTVQPLKAVATAVPGFLESMGATGEPFCFTVPAVHFRVLWERLLPRAALACEPNARGGISRGPDVRDDP